MSSYVDKEYFYYLRGRELLLYKLLGSRNRTRITQTGILQSYHNELMYPDEDITDGLRIEYTALNEPFILEALESTTAKYSGSDILFTASSNYIRVATSNAFQNAGFVVGDKIRVIGSGSNDGDYTISAIGNVVDGGVTYSRITASESVTTEAVGESITIYQIPKEVTSPISTSHINLNKMLSLAVVDYVKAMIHEERGEIDKKEYYIKEFYSKLADNESNKRIVSTAFPVSPYAVR
jgi:hypothetical protein